MTAIFESIRRRLMEMPEIYRLNYVRARTRKSQTAAIKAFCIECMGDQREEIKLCTDYGCPLYMYRPYVGVPRKAGLLHIRREVANICRLTDAESKKAP